MTNNKFLDLDQFMDDVICHIIDEFNHGDNSNKLKKVYDIFDDSRTYDSVEEKSEKKINSYKKRSQKKITICIGFSKYEAVRRVIRMLRFEEVGEQDNWNLYWTDGFITPDKMFHLKEYQKINHFPGMIEICRKDSLARNVNRLLKRFPNDFEIIPKTWCLPSDIIDFQAYCRSHRYRNYILKPEASCQGKGILITQNVKDMKITDGMVCQVYIDHPFLMDEYKFDLRIYVLITSIEPLRIYVYNEGLVRFTTVKYEEPNQKNINNIFMHLTNYTVQKESSNFIWNNEYIGTKRRFSVLNGWFIKHGFNIKKIWQDIDDVIIKTLISVQGTLRHNYRSAFPNHTTVSACFEILGFDIILDDQLQPLLIEVNHSPSFNTDSKVDRDVKDALLLDTFRLLNLHTIKESLFYKEQSQSAKRRLYQNSKSFSRSEETMFLHNLKQKIFELERADIGNYRLLYPASNSEYYDRFIRNSISLFNETVSYRARLKCAHKLRNNIRKKQKKIDAVKKVVVKNIKPSLQYSARMTKSLKPVELKILQRETCKIIYNLEQFQIVNETVEAILICSNLRMKEIQDDELLKFLSFLDSFFPAGDCESLKVSTQEHEYPNILGDGNSTPGCAIPVDTDLDNLSVATQITCVEQMHHYQAVTVNIIHWNNSFHKKVHYP